MNAKPPWWFRHAACRGRGHAAFIGSSGNIRMAKTICYTCPVMEVCLMYAMSLEDPVNRSGVFGGASAADRRRLARRSGVTPEKAKEWYLSEQDRFRRTLDARATPVVD